MSVKCLIRNQIASMLIAVISFSVCALQAMPTVIVTPNSARAVEKSAAAELANYLNAITGKTLQIVEEAKYDGKQNAFFVGDTAAAKKEFPAQFGYDGIAIRSVGKNIILTGHPQRGALYAVYTLLEKYAGVRWYTSDATFIPKKADLSFDKLNEVYTPKFRLRETHYPDAYKAPFAVKLKNNGHFANLPEKYGKNERILGYIHTFDQILPPWKYFKAHPEWYSLQKGKRTLAPYHQLCLTNEEMRKEFVKNLLALIAKNPQVTIVSVSQNPGFGRCECPNCRSLEEQEGSAAGPMLRFVNKVAAEVNSKYPGLLVDTMSFLYTRKAPWVARPADNVVIRYSDIEADFSQPIGSGANNARFTRDIQLWSRIAPRMMFWHYTGQFNNPLLPYPTWMNYSADIKFFADNNAIGIFAEGDKFEKIGDFSEMRAYVISHLLWDPTLDQGKLMDEFLTGYYGEAGKELRKYLDFMAQTYLKSGKKLNSSSGGRHLLHWLSPEDIVTADKYFDNALKIAAGNAVYTERILRARIPLDAAAFKIYPYLRSVNKVGIFSAEKWQQKADALESFCKKYFTPRVRSMAALWNYESRFNAILKQQDVIPAQCQNMPREKFVDFQECFFDVSEVGKSVFPADDPAASDGKVLRVIAPKRLIQLHLDLPLQQGKKWKVQITLRSSTAGLNPETRVLSAGYLNTQVPAGVRVFAAKSLKDNQFTTIELPAINPRNDFAVFIQPLAASPDRPLFIDNITVIVE